MHQGAGQSGGAQGDYHKYMDKYSGNHTQQSGGDYQKYMKQYGAQGGDYKKFMQQGGTSSGALNGNYQQYMKLYAGNYSNEYAGKYMQQNGSSNATELYENYKDMYAGKWAPKQDNMSSKDAFHQYASTYVPGVHNTSDSKAWASAYENKYAGAYKGDIKEDERLAEPLPCESAAACKTVLDLQTWRKHEMERVRAFVPASYQSGAEDSVNAEYHKNE